MIKTILDFFKKRYLSVNEIVSQLYDFLWMSEDYQYANLVDVFQGEGGNYFVFIAGGKIYQGSYNVVGREIEVFDIIPIELEQQERTKFFVTRIAEDKLQFVAIAASAVLNRVAEIDSRSLFDSFEENFVEPVPMIFYHVNDEKLRMGEIDNVFRYGNFLLVTGTVDENTRLGKNFESKIKEGGWGLSIGYYPHEKEVINIGRVKINVFTSGQLGEVSLVKEEDAANYYTRIYSLGEL